MLLLSRSLGRKIIATATAAVAFAFLYEVTILDSRYAARQAELREADGDPGAGRATSFHRDRLLQRDHDRLGGERPDRHRGGRPRPPAGRLGDPGRSPAATVQRHLHRSWIPVPPCRGATSTSTCGAATRRCTSSAGGSAGIDGASAWLESARQHAASRRPPLPAARGSASRRSRIGASGRLTRARRSSRIDRLPSVQSAMHRLAQVG